MISAWESLHFATLELVRSTPIKQRLVCAFRRHLAGIRAEQLPAEVRESFEQVITSYHVVKPLRGEDAVSASVRKMSVQEADECAATIVEIYGVTSRALLNLSRPSAAVLQLRDSERATGDYQESPLIASV